MIQQEQGAQFKISEFFNIVGLGQVLSGEILKGEINIGDIFEVKVENTTVVYRIDAVEKVDYPLRNEVETGLIVEPIEQNSIFNLGDFIGQTIVVLKA